MAWIAQRFFLTLGFRSFIISGVCAFVIVDLDALAEADPGNSCFPADADPDALNDADNFGPGSCSGCPALFLLKFQNH